MPAGLLAMVEGPWARAAAPALATPALSVAISYSMMPPAWLVCWYMSVSNARVGTDSLCKCVCIKNPVTGRPLPWIGLGKMDVIMV
ncbi:hypothetical protein D3C80_1636940 [compost metagenome]